MLYIYFLIVTAGILFSYLLLRYGEKNIPTLSFLITILACTMWSLSIFLHWSTDAPVFWGKATFIAAILIPVSLLFFSLTYPQKKIKLTWYNSLAIIVFPFLLLILTPTDFIIKSITADRTIIYNLGHKIFIAYFFTYILGVIFLTIQGLRKYKGLNKAKLQYFFLGLLCAVLGASITNIILPILGTNAYNKIGPIFILIFFTFTVVSIVKHQLMDISVVINRTAAYTLSGLFYTSIYLSFVFVYTTYINTEINSVFLTITIILAGITAYLFPKSTSKLENFTKKMFLPVKANYEDISLLISKKLTQCANVVGLNRVLQEKLVKELKFSEAWIYIPRKNKKEINFIYLNPHTGKAEPDTNPLLQDSEELQLLKKLKETQVLEFLGDKDPIKAVLEQHQAQACLPCRAANELQCLVFLGSKQEDEIYTNFDFYFLETLSTHIGATVARAQPYERLDQQFQDTKEHLQELAKDAAYTEVVKSVLHEINNPMSALTGYVDVLRDNYNNPETVKEIVDIFKEAFMRLEDISDHMLKFAGIWIKKKEFVKIQDTIEGIRKLNEPLFKKNYIKFDFQIEPDVPEISVDVNRLYQALLNLLLNAIDAIKIKNVKLKVGDEIPAQSYITVKIKKADFRDGHRVFHEGIEIKISDTGIGIPEEHQDKIFRTLFSTKARGMGIGLSVVAKVIDQHSGLINVESPEGQGTIFTIFLPISADLPFVEKQPQENGLHTSTEEDEDASLLDLPDRPIDDDNFDSVSS